MRNSLLVLSALALFIAAPSLALSNELNVAHRWAIGLQANGFDYGLAPTVEYWTSENFGVSASLTGSIWWAELGLRGTYLWNTPVHIFSIPARPYAGAGLGVVRYYGGAHRGAQIEVFGGLLQPITDEWSFRAEMIGASSALAGWHAGFLPLHPGFARPRDLLPLPGKVAVATANRRYA